MFYDERNLYEEKIDFYFNQKKISVFFLNWLSNERANVIAWLMQYLRWETSSGVSHFIPKNLRIGIRKNDDNFFQYQTRGYSN